MTARDALRAAGTSRAAIESHYDVSDDFFSMWLGDDMVYSCALWDESNGADTLEAAQRRKLDYFARQLGVRESNVLDIGCGWGALLDRFSRAHGLGRGVGLTLSASQQAFAAARSVNGVDYRLESWVDHEPTQPYDAITCIEMTEHLASDLLSEDDKVDVYRNFFGRCASWLRDGGRMGLQLICLDNVGHQGSRAGRGALSELIRTEIFPESMPACLSELVLGWESNFLLDTFLDHPHHYQRTFRAWNTAFRARRDEAHRLAADPIPRTFERYFAAGEAIFRLREQSLYRVILTKRPEPKSWAVPLRPSSLPPPSTDTAADPNDSASAAAIRSHYDVSNAFYALFLGPTMMYSSAMWDADVSGGPSPVSLDEAHHHKIDFVADRVLHDGASRVLDVGCGWGGNLRRMMAVHGVDTGVGLTLSLAQRDHIGADPIPRTEIRVEGWSEHTPVAPYDAIVSYGAFEHFARDGSDRIERVNIYRRFFARCFAWLVDDGRLGLETIAHDEAPDTAAPLGRGPLGDSVLELFPESICPDLAEIVLGFEPYFEVELLQSDAPNFARTFRAWTLALRDHEAAAIELVGDETTRRFRRYLAASEAQFRMRTLTNYRFVLARRHTVRR